MSENRWHVGQKVYLRDVNENRARDPEFVPPVAEIVKIGRTLVHAEGPYGRVETFRIEDGRRNDAYEHQRLQTFEEFEEGHQRHAAYRRLADLGVSIKGGDLSSSLLNRIADLVEEDKEADPV